MAKKIIFSDETHFDFDVYVNKENCRIWDTENPHAYIQKPMHPKQVTVWCGFWSRGIFGPFFFENEQGEAVTINGDCYRAMLNEFLFTKIEQEEATLDVLRPVFEDCIISRRADVVWSPRSCDYYLWGAVKDKCYAHKPETVDALKDNIREPIDKIQLHTIDAVLRNWTDHVGYCMASRESHLIEIIFHY